MKIKCSRYPTSSPWPTWHAAVRLLYLPLKGERINIAFWFLVAAAVFDFLDGLAVHALQSSTTPFGQTARLAAEHGQLRGGSVSDTFRYVPQFCAYLEHQGLPCVMACVAHVRCAAFSALRLAKFNIDEFAVPMNSPGYPLRQTHF